MSYTLSFSADMIGAGLTLNAKLFDAAGAQSGATITAGIVEVMSKVYSYTATLPDGFVGTFVMYNPADTEDRAVFSVNPQEAENTDAKVSAVKAKTDNLPSDPADESSIQATLAAIAAYIDTEVAAIKAKTDNLPSAPADESSIQASIAALSAAVTVIDDFLDTEINTIITNLATVDTVVDGIAADVDSLGTSSAINILSVIDGDDIEVYQSDTWEFDGPLGAGVVLTDYEALAFVIKRSESVADADAALYLRSDTGLVAIGGAAPVSAANGVLTIESATEFSVLVHMVETNVEPHTSYKWWLKGLDLSATPDRGQTIATGRFTIKRHGVRAIV